MVRKSQKTWAEVGFHNTGIRTTARGLKFALEWGLATAVLGHEPASVEEFAKLAEQSRATAFRNQQAFRDAFPLEASPARMNRDTGAQARYDDLYRRLKNRKKLSTEAQPLMYLVGGSVAS
jgi:hypothetical protein